MDINVQGTFLVLGSVTAAMTSQEPQAVDPNVPARGSSRGAIVNLGSIASFIALPQSPQYVASKHAVIGLTKSAGKSSGGPASKQTFRPAVLMILYPALDNVGNGIRVNCVCPSFVETPMMRNLFAAAPPMEQAILSQLPMGRLALPEEVADLIVFLCSSKSSYANGGVFTLDGAMTVGPHVSV
jgi:NAD(P)-dependent dehydrogenase (short-subunit alcohol dehydrogenase family)